VPKIPERRPVGDPFSGLVLDSVGRKVLAIAPQPNTQVLAAGNLVIRYAVRYLGKPHVSIVPGLVALDYGDMLTGEEAWDFLLHHSNLHPRADVLGYRNDGGDDMIVVKLLDLAQPVEVLVYNDEAATKPLAKVEALIAESSAGAPARLLANLPCYHTLADWKASLE
jgi:hypothetical protein